MATGGLCLACAVASPAQEIQQVKSDAPRLEDVYNVLEDLGIRVFRFDLSSFLHDVYNVEGYVAEYKNNKPTGNVHTFELGANIRSLDEIPEEHRQGFRKTYHIPDGENQWESIKDLVVCIRHMETKDSTAIIQVSSSQVGSMAKPFKLQPVGVHRTYLYDARPFSLNSTEGNGDLEIPLVLYASWWEEPGTTLIRFCGENEIDPEMKAEILTHIPHCYVIGIKFKRKE